MEPAFSLMPFPTIGDQLWQREAVQNATELYSDLHLQTYAAILARHHRFADELLRQAPVMLVALAPARNRDDIEKRFLGRATALIERERKPRAILLKLDLAPQLWALSGRALISAQLNTLRRLSRLPPSTLAQAIPETRDGQQNWLWALSQWSARMERAGRPPDLNFAWLAPAIARAGAWQQWTEVADLSLHLMDRVNPRWSWEKAHAEAQAWHAELAKMKQGASFFRTFGRNFDDPIDYAPLPAEADAYGHTVVALRSGRDLYEDGRAMRHCVSSYAGEVIRGTSRIYSIRHGEKRLATLELTRAKKAWAIVQLKGPCNTAPAASTKLVARAFLDACNGKPAASGAAEAPAEAML